MEFPQQTRDPAPNVVDNKDQHPRLSPSLHMRHVGTATPYTLCALEVTLDCGWPCLRQRENMSQATSLINDSQTSTQRELLHVQLWAACGRLPRSSMPTGVCPPKVLGYLNLDVRVTFFFYWQSITWTFFICLILGEIYDIFNFRKFCFPWHFITLHIWNISIPDNKYYAIIVFIWTGYFLLNFLTPFSQLMIVKIY